MLIWLFVEKSMVQAGSGGFVALGNTARRMFGLNLKRGLKSGIGSLGKLPPVALYAQFH
jgi:hypothetical protein